MVLVQTIFWPQGHSWISRFYHNCLPGRKEKGVNEKKKLVNLRCYRSKNDFLVIVDVIGLHRQQDWSILSLPGAFLRNRVWLVWIFKVTGGTTLWFLFRFSWILDPFLAHQTDQPPSVIPNLTRVYAWYEEIIASSHYCWDIDMAEIRPPENLFFSKCPSFSCFSRLVPNGGAG